MGYMGCNRCDSAMCDRLSDKFGYICYPCFQELIQTLLVKGIGADIREFMQTSKQEFSYQEKEAVEAYLNALFPNIRNQD